MGFAGGRRTVSARMDDVLWDTKLKVAPYDKQNASTGAREEGRDKSYELHSSVD